MCFRKNVGVGYGAACCGIIFDVEYKPLENLKAQSYKFFDGLGDGAKFNESKYYWKWPSGEKLYLRAARTLKDAENYLGHEYTFIGFNELSKWPTPELYDHLSATQRCPEARRLGIKPLMFSTTNPYGTGTVWLRDRFITPVPYGVMAVEEIEVPMDNDRVEVIPKSRIALAGHYKENPYYPPEQVATLIQATQDNPHLAAAWLRCDWSAAYMDGVIGDLWSLDKHVVEDFPIPDNWMVNRAFDWGSSAPFSVGWFAESNGEDVRYNGQTYNYPRGSVIMFAEWYGAKRQGTNRGIKLSPADVAMGIKQREYDMPAKGILGRGHPIYPGPADNQISNVERVDFETIEKIMQKLGIYWTKSDKSKGSRRMGLQVLRQYLRNSITGEGPGLYIQRKCRAAIKLLPPLEREGEDIASAQEDHIYDMLRYRLTKAGQSVIDVDIRVH